MTKLLRSPEHSITVGIPLATPAKPLVERQSGKAFKPSRYSRGGGAAFYAACPAIGIAQADALQNS
jgi:hypothetical protein